MKLRLHRDSLRLRLNPGDIRQLLETGSVSHAVTFAPGAEFLYSLHTRAEATTVRAILEVPGVCICVEVPQSLAADWATSDTVGIDASQDVGAGRSLQISIEKDFECLHPSGSAAKDEDFFPNPRKVAR